MHKIVPDATDIYCHNFEKNAYYCISCILLLFTNVVNMRLVEINLKSHFEIKMAIATNLLTTSMMLTPDI